MEIQDEILCMKFLRNSLPTELLYLFDTEKRAVALPA